MSPDSCPENDCPKLDNIDAYCKGFWPFTLWGLIWTQLLTSSSVSPAYRSCISWWVFVFACFMCQYEQLRHNINLVSYCVTLPTAYLVTAFILFSSLLSSLTYRRVGKINGAIIHWIMLNALSLILDKWLWWIIVAWDLMLTLPSSLFWMQKF